MKFNNGLLEQKSALCRYLDDMLHEATNAETPLDKDTGSGRDEPGLIREMFPLQSLMFRVGNNLLSIPLTELHSVVEWQGKLTCLPNAADWMVGVLRYRDSNICVVDSAAILQIKRDASITARYILVLGDQKWGIMCDQIDTIVTLHFEDIQWNRNQNNTISYGTIRDSLASFLNPSGFIRQLALQQLTTIE